jgi:hypothetical protein
MRPSLALFGCLAARSVDSYPHFEALHVWPRPRDFTFISDPRQPAGFGPARVDSATLERTVDASCGEKVEALLDKAIAPLTTSRVHDTMTNHRTWPRRAYSSVDLVCPLGARCENDVDCNAASGSTCLVDPTRGRRWNSSHLCNPRSAADALCGCCSDSTTTVKSIVISTCSDGELTHESPEAYSLRIDPGGSDLTAAAITIRAATPQGAAHAVSVLSQLIEWDELSTHESLLPSSPSATTAAAAAAARARGWLGCRWPVHIEDSPRFPWRGLLVDTSRHIISVDTLKAILNGMAAARLNRLHWHIVDAPSFAYESASHPELARDGSWTGEINSRTGSGGHREAAFNPSAYSTVDVAAVVAHAESLFIDVMFELDTPAHTMSWGRSHPEIMAVRNKTPFCLRPLLRPLFVQKTIILPRQARDKHTG